MTRCDLLMAIFLLLVGSLLAYLSFWSISSVHDPWRTIDYWFAWFSAATFIGALCTTAIGVVATSTVLSNFCNKKS